MINPILYHSNAISRLTQNASAITQTKLDPHDHQNIQSSSTLIVISQNPVPHHPWSPERLKVGTSQSNSWRAQKDPHPPQPRTCHHPRLSFHLLSSPRTWATALVCARSTKCARATASIRPARFQPLLRHFLSPCAVHASYLRGGLSSKLLRAC